MTYQLKKVVASVTNIDFLRGGRRVPILLVTIGGICCAPRGVHSEHPLLAGRVYQLQLVASAKPRLTPERAAALGPLQDSLTGTLSVDSVVHDSALGHYQLNMLKLGMMATPAAPAALRFVAVANGANLELHLNPDVTDAGVYFVGQPREGRVIGTWHDQKGEAKGTFVLRDQQ
ncbi:MAG: hypothetical protein ABJD11_13175 [Gemmatimonadota bacterium]